MSEEKILALIECGRQNGWSSKFVLDQLERWARGERGATSHDEAVVILGRGME